VLFTDELEESTFAESVELPVLFPLHAATENETANANNVIFNVFFMMFILNMLMINKNVLLMFGGRREVRKSGKSESWKKRTFDIWSGVKSELKREIDVGLNICAGFEQRGGVSPNKFLPDFPTFRTFGLPPKIYLRFNFFLSIMGYNFA